MSAKLISEITSDNSKIFKENILRQEALSNNDDFFAGLRYALDNITSFGVKKIPERNGDPGKGLSFSEFSLLANKLINRDLTGNSAISAINEAMINSNNEDWNGWYRKILIKDLGAGFSETTVNKAVKIPVTPYMRCSLPEKSNQENWNWHQGVYSQLKADGSFAYVNIDYSGNVTIMTRNGTIYPDYSLAIDDIVKDTFSHNTSTHGELTIYQDGKLLERQLGNGVLNSLLSGGSLLLNQVVVFDAWDQIPLPELKSKGMYEVPYSTRFKILSEQINPSLSRIKLIETLICYSPDEALTHYREMRSRGLEGTICKSADAIWKDGTSKDLVKQKEMVDVELKVVGFTEGKNKNKHLFGALLCQSECGLLDVSVGSGFSDELRTQIHNNRSEWIDSIVTVRSNDIMYATKSGNKHSLFLPRLIEQRLDKSNADSFDDIKLQFSAAIRR